MKRKDTAHIIVGAIQSSHITGQLHSSNVPVTIPHVKASHLELYLVPPYFFIIISISLCNVRENYLNPQILELLLELSIFVYKINFLFTLTRIEHEKTVVGKMIAVYCRRHHSSDNRSLCDDCSDLLRYAHKRLEHCPKGNTKSSCRRCENHCYASAQRRKMQAVMRYVGPRMIFIHPLTALRHILD
ncbi:MAG: nitrous oxide-stimulated promoter family protein [Paramuribaculum sp.]|nr:nitrous oxide-stimulated promoter family protein [Paramuribaculum sp.]